MDVSRKRVAVVSLQRLGDTITAARITEGWAQRPDVESVTLVHWDHTEQAAALLPGVLETLPLPYTALRRGRRIHPLASFETLAGWLDVEPFDVVINASSTRFACFVAPVLARRGGELYGAWIDANGKYAGSHPSVDYLNEWGVERDLNVFSHQDIYTLAADVELSTRGRLVLSSAVEDEVANLLDDVTGGADPFVVHVHSSDPAKDWRDPFADESWHALIDRLQRELGYAVFLAGGPKDAPTVERLAKQCNARPALWSLERTAALLRRAAGLISVDTVSIHLAARVGCPTIVLRQGPAGGLAFAPGPQALLVDLRTELATADDVVTLTRAFVRGEALDFHHASEIGARIRVRETFRDADAFIGARTPPWIAPQRDDVAEDLSDARWRQAWRASWSSAPAPCGLARFVNQPQNVFDERRLRSVTASEHRLGTWLRDGCEEVA